MRQIEAVRKWMEEEPGRYTLDQLAALAALSPYHFHRVFAATYGATPLRYLNECRLQRARRLLELGWNVQAACFEVGFSSPASFHRKFRVRFGFTPGSCRPSRKPA